MSWPARSAAVLVFIMLATASSAHASERLTHSGRWFIDDRGRVVIQHGVAVMDFGPAHLPATFFKEHDAAFLAQHGFDVVRVGMNWSGIEPQPGVIDPAYVNSILGTVRTLAAHGIYSILDLHQDEYGPAVGVDGAPAWATLTDGAPNIPLGPGVGYFGNPALERAFDNLWANTPGPGGIGVADRYAAMVASLGHTFHSEPYLLGYELFNEPWPGSQYATCMGPTGCPVFDMQLSAFYRRVTAALRQTDAGHIVFYEPNLFFNSGANTNLQDPGGGDSQAGFAFHDYCLGAGAGAGLPTVPNSGPGCAVEETAVMGNANAYAEKSAAAVINTEWSNVDDLSVNARVADEFDQYEIPWTFWAYGAPRFVTNLAILERAYPRVIAGTPTSWAWDSTANTLTFDYSTRTPAGAASRAAPTEIYVPALHFPTGYSVRVTGARVISAPGDGLLRLCNAPGAATVSVRIAADSGGSTSTPVEGAVSAACAFGASHSAAPITLPSARRCIRRRRVVIRLHRPTGTRILRATVYVNGRRVGITRRATRRGRLELRRLPRGAFTVRVVLRLRTRRGVRTISALRRYRACAG